MKEYYSLRGFEKGPFHYSAVHVKTVFCSPEMLKNLLAVTGCFAHILAGKNVLLNNYYGFTTSYCGTNKER